MSTDALPEPFHIAGHEVAAGTGKLVDIPVSRLSTGLEVGLRVKVLHGSRPGPVLFVSGSLHGDEIIGVEIVRRLLSQVDLHSLAGTLLCIPVVNAYGFVAHQRYLPDRRDLNRCFPGSETGSLASQLAYKFTTEILERSDCGIDLHTAGLHRENLPQIRISADRPYAMELAEAFGPPAIITSRLREGSLRKAGLDHDCEVLLLEAGEALRFDELSMLIGVQGILRVMAHLGMGVVPPGDSPANPIRSRQTSWVRAPVGGIFRNIRTSGTMVAEGEVLGYLADPFGTFDTPILAPMEGLIIGRSNLPVVNRGDALIHMAQVETPETAGSRFTEIEELAYAQALEDDDEIV